MKRLVLLGLLGAVMTAQATEVKYDSTKVEQLQEVVVQGVRAQKNAPYAITNIKKKELNEFAKTGKELPFLFSQTISWWPCRTMGGTLSLPGEAALTMMTLPTSSVLYSRFLWAAKLIRKALMSSSCPDSLGIRVISLKISSTLDEFILTPVFNIWLQEQASFRCRRHIA